MFFVYCAAKYGPLRLFVAHPIYVIYVIYLYESMPKIEHKWHQTPRIFHTVYLSFMYQQCKDEN